MSRCQTCLWLAALLVFSTGALRADLVFLDFEGLPDSTPVTNQFAGLVFSNTTAISAGLTLNEFEFPPRSGANVVFDDQGPMSISFTIPLLSFSAYFTYLTPITLSAFDASNNLLGSVTSGFANNLALSGDPSSSPNELLQLAFGGTTISSITIAGDPFGGSFTMDDVSAVNTIPEPSSILLLLTAMAGVGFHLRKFRG